jgi:hypothetical protein
MASCVRDDLPYNPRPASDKALGLVPMDTFRPKAYASQQYKNTPVDNTSYSEGFQAGCQTMASAVGEGLYRLRGPKLDADRLSTDAWYLRGYDDGGAYCFYALDWELH